MPQLVLRPSEIRRVFGDGGRGELNARGELAARELLSAVSRYYHVFHLVAEEGSYFRGAGEAVTDAWRELLGQRVIRLVDHRRMAEVIVSAIQVTEGADPGAVADSWGDEAAEAVSAAVADLPAPLLALGGGRGGGKPPVGLIEFGGGR